MFVYNDKQEQFIKDPIVDAILVGHSGTGKTTCIIKKATNHLTAKEFIIVHNSKLKDTNIQNNIKTFHMLAENILLKLENKQCRSTSISLLATIQTIKKYNIDTLKTVKYLEQLKAIFVDDAHHMTQLQYNFLIELKNKLDIKLILVGDDSLSNVNYFAKYRTDRHAKKYIFDKTYVVSVNKQINNKFMQTSSKEILYLIKKYFRNDDFIGLYNNLGFYETRYRLYKAHRINTNVDQNIVANFMKNLLEYYSSLLSYTSSVFLDNADKNKVSPEILDKIKHNIDVDKNILMMSLSLIKKSVPDPDNLFNMLQHHINKIKRLALLTKECTFFKKISHPNLKIYGTSDIIFDNTVVFLTFGDVRTIDKITAFLLYHCFDNKWVKKSFEIWDLNSGISHIVNFRDNISNFDISMALAIKFCIKMEDLIFVYDLETTGLNTGSCEIIERYFYELTHAVQVSNGLIKPKKYIPPTVLNITGITKKELKTAESLSVFKSQMSLITANSIDPLFVAHNGNVFDHKIMKIQNILHDKCKFLDSRMLIRQLSTVKIGQESLSEIYEKICGGKFHGKAHRAKADVIMLLHIFNKLCITKDTFLLLK